MRQAVTPDVTSCDTEVKLKDFLPVLSQVRYPCSGNRVSRQTAYRWMAELMIDPKDGWLTPVDCQRLIDHAQTRVETLKRKYL